MKNTATKTAFEDAMQEALAKLPYDRRTLEALKAHLHALTKHAQAAEGNVMVAYRRFQKSLEGHDGPLFDLLTAMCVWLMPSGKKATSTVVTPVTSVRSRDVQEKETPQTQTATNVNSFPNGNVRHMRQFQYERSVTPPTPERMKQLKRIADKREEDAVVARRNLDVTIFNMEIAGTRAFSHCKLTLRESLPKQIALLRAAGADKARIRADIELIGLILREPGAENDGQALPYWMDPERWSELKAMHSAIKADVSETEELSVDELEGRLCPA